MNIKERMMAVYKNTMPDKIPVGIYKRYLPTGSIERSVRDAGLGIIDYYPVASFVGPPWHNLPGFLSEVKNTEISISYIWDGGNYIEKSVYSTPVGSIFQLKEKSVGAGSEHIKKHYINDIEDYKVMQYIVENTVVKSNEATIRGRMESLGDDGVVLARMDRSPYQKFMIEFAGAERFLIDLFTDKEVVDEVLEAMSFKMQEAFEIALGSAADLVWQPDNVTSDMTPPQYFKEYCLPFYQKYSSQLKQAGKTYIAHFDGKIKALCEDILNSGIDVVESFSLPMVAGDMEISEAKQTLGDIVVLPNFPSNLSTASESEIREFLRNFKSETQDRFPIMLQVSEDLAEGEWSRVLPIIMGEFK